MILAIDIGNSNIVIALFKDNEWSHTFRYETKSIQPELFYENALRNIFLEWAIHKPSDIEDCVISSVVPDINQVIINAVENVTGHQPVLLGPDIFTKMEFHVPLPYEIGSDIVANAYASTHLYHPRCIVVDFGTALTFTIANKNQGIVGVTIAPGIKTSLGALSQQTAQLPLVSLSVPDSVIGHDTTSAIQAGVLWGYVGLVKEIIHRMHIELEGDYKVIATGGTSGFLQPLNHVFDYHDKLLTLNGIRLICQWWKGYQPQ